MWASENLSRSINGVRNNLFLNVLLLVNTRKKNRSYNSLGCPKQYCINTAAGNRIFVRLLI
jgi:hypothetical protein